LRGEINGYFTGSRNGRVAIGAEESDGGELPNVVVGHGDAKDGEMRRRGWRWVHVIDGIVIEDKRFVKGIP